MHEDQEKLDHQKLDLELDEALDMTFPASDPLAASAPGSTSRRAVLGRDADAGDGGRDRGRTASSHGAR